MRSMWNWFGRPSFNNPARTARRLSPVPSAARRRKARLFALESLESRLCLTTPPVAVDDLADVKIDTTGYIYALYNDFDPDGSIDYFSGQVESLPSNGSVVFEVDYFVYTPNPGYLGPDSFTYTVKDNDGLISNIATVTISVNPNQPPIAGDDTADVKEDTATFIYSYFNDSDPDGSLDYSSYQVVDAPVNGSVVYDPNYFAFVYTPNLGYLGPDSFTYTVADDNGALSNVATVTISVNPNQPPTAVDDAATVIESPTANVLDILFNDSDPDGFLVESSFSVVTPPANGAVAFDPILGVPVYTANPGYIGPDSFSYTIADDNGAPSNIATVTLDVVINQPPVANNDSLTAFFGSGWDVYLLDNDVDPVGMIVPSTVSVVTAPSHGSVVIDSNTGVATYTPDLGYIGSDQFTYTVLDNSGAVSNVATVAITVYQPLVVTQGGADPAALVNALLAPDPQLTIVPGSIVYIGTNDQAGFFSDLNYAPILSIANGIILTSGSAETALINEPSSTGATGQGSQAGDGDLTALIGGTPTFGANVLEFEFDVEEGVQSIAFDFIFGSEEFPEFVGSYNDVFGVFLDGVQIAFDGDGKPVTVNNNFFLLNNTNPDNTTDPDTAGKTVIDLNSIEYDGLTPRLTTNVGVTPGRHRIKFAIADAGDNVLDSGVFLSSLRALRDDGGGGSTGQPPEAEDDEAQTVGTTPVAINVLANDSDPDGTIDPATVSINASPANGSVVVDPMTGIVTYTANPGFTGSDIFTYTVKDDDGVISNIAQVTVEVVAPLFVTDVKVAFGSQSISLIGNTRVLPWANLSSIQIAFNYDVQVDIADLALTGVNVANYAFASFAYDGTTYTATWNLVSAPTADRLILTLDGDDATSDGNQGVTAGALPLLGGDYIHNFSVLIGDYNSDGKVTMADVIAIRNHTPAYGAYSIWADLDGDGDVDTNDINTARRRIGTRLP